jgi:nitroreductase
MNDIATSIDDAITSRHSVRAFLDQPVSRESIEHILNVARYAPSGTNTQPWQVYVLAGEIKTALSAAILAELEANPEAQEREYEYYPTEWFEPYLGRRRACGWGLYGALGIQRGENARMHEQRARNYTFFDAPIGLIITIERRLNIGSWMDLGMFLQNIMLSARGQGLHSCPQAAFANYHRLIRDHLPVSDEEIVVCGMAIGYRDALAPENIWRTDRAPLSSFTRWLGF